MKKLVTSFVVLLGLIIETDLSALVISNLSDAIRIGLENNRDLKVKMLDVMAANANVKSSLADLILPNISANIRFTTLDPNTIEKSISKVSLMKVVTNYLGPITNIGFQMEEKVITNAFWDNYSLGLTITYRVPYLIPFGLDISLNSYLLQIKNKELSELQYQKAVSDYIYNLKIAYYNYLFAKEFSKIAIETDKRLEENLKIAEANFKAGIFSDLELIRAKVQHINNKPNLLASQNNLRIQKANLLTLLGLDISKIDEVEILGDIEDVKREYSEVSIDFEKEKQKILENNLDLKILRKLKEISSVSKKISLSANKPTISVFFNYNYEFKKTNSMDNNRTWVDSWNTGIQLTVPISELLPISKSYANIENSEYSIEKSHHNYINTLNFIMNQVEQIRLKYKESIENIKAQEANVEQAKRALQIVTERYKFGFASTIELMDAQISYQQAEINLLSSWINYINNILTIKKLSGEM